VRSGSLHGQTGGQVPEAIGGAVAPLAVPRHPSFISDASEICARDLTVKLRGAHKLHRGVQATRKIAAFDRVLAFQFL
jgi:hypothetical protein